MRASDVIFLLALPFAVLSLWLLVSTSERGRKAGLLMMVFFSAQYKYKDVMFHAYRGHSRGFSVGVVDLVTWAFLLELVLHGRKSGKPLGWCPSGFPLVLLFGAFCLLSLPGAYAPLYAMFGIFKYFKCALMFWVLVNLLDDEDDIRWLAACCAFTLGYMGLQVLWHRYVAHIHLSRAQGPFSHPNTLAMVCNLLMPFAFSLAMDSESRLEAALYGIATYLGMIAVVFTKSRAGLVIMGASFALNFLLSFRHGITIRKSAVLALFLIGGTVTGAALAPKIIKRFKTAPKESAEARKRFNVAARHMAAEHPLGVGVNNYPYVLGHTKYYYDVYPELAESGGEIGELTSRLGVCHHIYNLVAAETGYGGLAAYLLMIGWYFVLALRYALPSRSPPLVNTLGTAALCGFFSLHLQGLLEWVWFQNQMLSFFFIVCALTVSLGELSGGGSTTGRNQRQEADAADEPGGRAGTRKVIRTRTLLIPRRR